jgi:hypothetical protein
MDARRDGGDILDHVGVFADLLAVVVLAEGQREIMLKKVSDHS